METPERNSERKSERGITLIEIMIVLAILGLIMGLFIGPRVNAMFKEGRLKTAWLEAKEFEQAYSQWSSDNDAECPEKLDELLKYRNKKNIQDPWNTAYVMRCGQAEPESGFGVYSFGPNKTDDNTEGDDIASWKAQPKRK